MVFSSKTILELNDSLGFNDSLSSCNRALDICSSVHVRISSSASVTRENQGIHRKKAYITKLQNTHT